MRKSPRCHMRNKKSNLIEPIKLPVHEYKSYWATHFYSVLQCLDKHKNLQYSPRRLPNFPLWTMNELRGHFLQDFFNYIHSYMANWGMQYFLCNLFNQKIGGTIVNELKSRLGDMYDFDLSGKFDEFHFYVSGEDSALGMILMDTFNIVPDVFPLRGHDSDLNRDEFINLVKYSDICLILESSSTREKVSVFGEVEGVYGDRISQPSFWDRKQELCVFAFGVIPGKNKNIYFQNFFHRNQKCLFFIEGESYIAHDFRITLNFFNHLFHFGAHDNRYTQAILNDEEFKYFAEESARHWNRPIQEFLAFLEKFISEDTLIGKSHDPCAITQTLTDLQTATREN